MALPRPPKVLDSTHRNLTSSSSAQSTKKRHATFKQAQASPAGLRRACATACTARWRAPCQHPSA
eukprot:8620780-Pyramimonas_sp.AAC.1